MTSSGDGEDRPERVQRVMGGNPQLHWQNSRRGYVGCRVTPDEWRTDYRTVESVSRPGTPFRTPARWRLEAGRPGIQRV